MAPFINFNADSNAISTDHTTLAQTRRAERAGNPKPADNAKAKRKTEHENDLFCDDDPGLRAGRAMPGQ
jgi:hypothetical protein